MHLQVWQWIVGSLEFMIAFAYVGWYKRVGTHGVIGFWVPVWLHEALVFTPHVSEQQHILAAIEAEKKRIERMRRQIGPLMQQRREFRLAAGRGDPFYWT